MRRRDAALRGAATALLWAGLVFALLASLGELVAQRRPPRGDIEHFADVVLDNMQGAGPISVTVALVIVSAAAGAVMGLLARRLRSNALARCAILTLAALPALWLMVAVAWAVAWMPTVIVEKPSSLLWMPLGALWFSGIGIVVAAPVLVVPAAMAAVLLEGWTRPEALPQTGLARPTLRRWVLLVLVVLVAALTTFAALNWTRGLLRAA